MNYAALNKAGLRFVSTGREYCMDSALCCLRFDLFNKSQLRFDNYWDTYYYWAYQYRPFVR